MTSGRLYPVLTGTMATCMYTRHSLEVVRPAARAFDGGRADLQSSWLAGR